MICETPITRGPRRGLPATGTSAGYQRHSAARESACTACRAGHNAETKVYRASLPPKPPKKVGRPPKPPEDAPERSVLTIKGRITPRPVPVYCKGCGRRGVANQAVLGRKRSIPACAECKKEETA